MSGLSTPVSLGWVLTIVAGALVSAAAWWLQNMYDDQRAMRIAIAANTQSIAVMQGMKEDLSEMKDAQAEIAQTVRSIENQLSRMEGTRLQNYPIPNMR